MGSITVTNLGKAYKVYPGRFARLKEWLLPFVKPQHTIKWVLQDINFSVNPGEAVGIIGINGAGKSTLLKMLTGTTQPTTGSVTTSGRVAALLELGIGFHPEFTGRQNAYMAGQLLGMSVNEIRELMPQIEDFAEIGDYMDHPVRVYSSGMQMRLAFSVATARRPDILIVDEALSVGDAYFQHKSFERIRQFRKEGTTLLIVSHDKQAIQSICDRAILLNAGCLEKQGKPALIMDYYNALVIKKADSEISISDQKINAIRVASGNGKAIIENIEILDKDGLPVDVVKVGEQTDLVVRIRITDTVNRLILGYQIKDRLGQTVYGTNTQYTQQPLQGCMSGDRYQFQIAFNAALGPGSYSIALALVDTDGVHVYENYEWNEMAALFTVVNIDKPHFIGCSWMQPTIKVLKI